MDVHVSVDGEPANDMLGAHDRVHDAMEWEPYLDDYDASWLPEYNPPRKGVLVDTDGFSPVDYFKLFFPDSVFDLIAEQTNLYALNFFDQPSEDDLPAHSRFSAWTETTAAEIKAYVALQIAMGIVSKPSLEDYWGTFWLTHIPFTQVMSRDR